MLKKSVFSELITNSITLYVQHVDKATSTETAVRIVLKNCFYDNDKAEIMKQTGAQTSFNAEIYIPYSERDTGRKYITPELWNKLSKTEVGKYWTISIAPITIIVNGEFKFEFTPTAVGTKTNERLAVQIANFRELNPSANLTALAVDPQLFGSENMKYFTVRC